MQDNQKITKAGPDRQPPPRRTPLQKPCEAARRPAPSVQRTSSRREDFMQKIRRGVSNIREVIIFVPGKLPEWSNGTDSKSVELRMWFLGFESLTFRHENRLAVSRACFLSSLRRGSGATGRRRPPVRKKNRTAIRRSDGGKTPGPPPENLRTENRNRKPAPAKRTGPADERIRSEKFVRESIIRPRRKTRHTKAVRRQPQRIRRSHERDGHVGQDRSGDRRTGKSTGPAAAVPPFRPGIVFGPGSSDEEKSSTHARPATTPAFACPSPERTAHLYGPACSDPACPAGRPAERTAVPDGKRTRRSDTRSEDRFFSMYVTLS